MSKEFNVGDEVMYNGVKYTISKVSPSKEILDIENDKTQTHVWAREVTQVQVAPTVTGVISREAIKYQQELDFGELTGDLPEFTRKEVNSDVYCSCSIPEVISNQAYGNSFLYCKGCRKERI